MDSVKEKARQMLVGNQEYLFNYNHGEVDVDYLQMIEYITSKMIEFARECCEKQKKECFCNAKAVGLGEVFLFIKDVKNICDN